MGTILEVLEGLDGESIQRVLDYVFDRLSITKSSRAFTTAVPVSTQTLGAEPGQPPRRVSIRDLKDEKQPESSNQMAALVAYYLSELAPESERRDTVGSADLERYFKQAGFKLPTAIYKTLPNAAAAGYFESVGGGRYRLNPVGYNLVVHGLPRADEKAARTRKASKKGGTKKAAKR